MTLKTLQNLEKELNYLLKDGTLEEVLTFLGIQYFEGSLKQGNETSHIYEFEDTCTLAIEISILDGSVKFWGNIPKFNRGLVHRSYWVWLSQQYPLILERLVRLLTEEYKSLGNLTFEINIQGEWFALELITSCLDSLEIAHLILLSDSDLEKLYS